MGPVRAPSPRRLRLLLIALVLLVIAPSIARWQMAALGLGLVAIGAVLLVQRRRRVPDPPTGPDRP